MAPYNRDDLLRELDPDFVEAILPLVAKAERHDIRMLLSCPEDSAGSLMTTEYASLPANITAGEAIARLRNQAPNSESIYYIYIFVKNCNDIFFAFTFLLLSKLYKFTIIDYLLFKIFIVKNILLLEYFSPDFIPCF